MSHVVTVWWLRGGEQRRDRFKAAHVRSHGVRGGWQVELMDKKWRVFRVEQFPPGCRVSIRRIDG